jgi:hypothetical protein
MYTIITDAINVETIAQWAEISIACGFIKTPFNFLDNLKF